MKVTKKHFNDYRKEVGRMMKLLCFDDWCVMYSHEKLDGYTAMWDANIPNRSVVFLLTTELDDVNGQLLDDITVMARHEVYEFLLHGMRAEMAKGKTDKETIARLSHEVVRKLEKLKV